jgi:hypothetical protein
VPLPDFLSLPSASYTRQSPWRQKGLCRLPLLGHSAKGLPRASANLPRGGGGWRRVCRVPNGRHSAKTKTLPSARIWHLGKFETLPNAGRPALGKVTNFFIPFFSIFRYKYNKNISEYRDIIGSYYNKYIIDK